jgi:hypothetical protein
MALHSEISKQDTECERIKEGYASPKNPEANLNPLAHKPYGSEINPI